MINRPATSVAGKCRERRRPAQGGPTMSPRKLNAVMGAVLSAIGTQKADAGCVGGEQIAAGNYAIEISGKRASGGAEDLSGTITSDGKCTLNIILQGRLNSALVAALSATGGYSVNEDHIGIL